MAEPHSSRSLADGPIAPVDAVWVHVATPAVRGLLQDAADAERIPCLFIDEEEELVRRLADARPAVLLVENDPPRIYAEDVAELLAPGSDDRSASDAVSLVLIAQPEAAPRLARMGATEVLEAPLGEAFVRARLRGWSAQLPVRWQRGPIPADEAERLQALARLSILDTPAEERYDRITRIACGALDVPVALISLVDRDRQWFKSCQGLSVSETSRDLAFCAHAVASSSELIVEDARADDRFADNPLVAGEPGIRFYAGVPLEVDGGHCIGTLCLIDFRPRTLAAGQLALLRDLRDLVVREIGLGSETADVAAASG